MNPHPCCHTAAGDRTQIPRPASPWRRGAGIAGWLLPSATLILLPKCPICIAMYVALFSGVGISVTTASTFRTGLIILCTGVLVGLALKALGRLAYRKKHSAFTPWPGSPPVAKS